LLNFTYIPIIPTSHNDAITQQVDWATKIHRTGDVLLNQEQGYVLLLANRVQRLIRFLTRPNGEDFKRWPLQLSFIKHNPIESVENQTRFIQIEIQLAWRINTVILSKYDQRTILRSVEMAVVGRWTMVSIERLLASLADT